MDKRSVGGMILVVLFAGAACAQSIRSYGVSFGAVNSNQAWNYSSLALDAHPLWGGTVGAFVERDELSFLNVRGEVRFTQNGFTESVPYTTVTNPDGTTGYLRYSPSEDYVSFSILGKFHYSLPIFTPYLLAGPRIDILVHKDPQGYDAVIDDFSRTDFGATIGAGIELNALVPFVPFVEFRYNPDFTDTYNTTSLDVRNRSIYLLVGVRL